MMESAEDHLSESQLSAVKIWTLEGFCEDGVSDGNYSGLHLHKVFHVVWFFRKSNGSFQSCTHF